MSGFKKFSARRSARTANCPSIFPQGLVSTCTETLCYVGVQAKRWLIHLKLIKVNNRGSEFGKDLLRFGPPSLVLFTRTSSQLRNDTEVDPTINYS